MNVYGKEAIKNLISKYTLGIPLLFNKAVSVLR